MIFVDSSVWIDYFRGVASAQAETLDALLDREPLATGDLVLTEVLQGFSTPSEATRALQLFATIDIVTVGGIDVAVQAAANYRRLRTLGVTVRKTIDTLIATRCIRDGLTLLHNDRDFDAFEEHLGLRVVEV